MATVPKAFKVKNGLIVDGAATDVFIGSDTLPEVIQDTVGGMVDGNTESNISVLYNDTTGKINFDIEDYTINLGGDLSGSLTIYNGTTVGTLSATIGANSVALGTDTSGDYVGSLAAGTGITVSTTAGEGLSVTITNSDRGSSQNIFKNVLVGTDTIVADSNDDTLTLTAGTGISLTASTTTDAVTFTNIGVTSLTATTTQITVSASTGNVSLSFPNTVTMPGSLVVTGDLTVNGTTTTLNVAELLVEDNVVVLNSNVTGTPSVDAGIEVERGTYTNAKIYWNETANKWYLSTPGDSNGAATEAEIATGGSLNIFASVSDGSVTATADSSNDTLNFAAGTGLTVAVNSTTDTVTYSFDAAATATVASVTMPNSKIEDGTVTSSGTSVTIDTFTLATYKSAKYVVQMTNGGGDAHLVEVLVTAVGTNAYIVEYAELITNTSLGDVTADSDGTTVTVSVGSTASGVVVKHTVTYIEA